MPTDSQDTAQAIMLDKKSSYDENNKMSNNANAGGDTVELQQFISLKQKPLPTKKSCSRFRLIAVSGTLITIFIGAVVILVLLFLLVGDRPPRIQLPCVDVTGDFDSATKTFIFRGIPFAVPPINELRFRPPVPLPMNETCKSDSVVFDAVNNPPQCVQKDIVSGHVSGSEDCLYLNIYSPAVDPLQLAPVMVFIHGGYLQYGNATTPGYCPNEHNAAKMGMVFVNIQYRLNAFGFLVTNIDNGRGNYGFHDQIVALRWIQSHIKKFGGDPKQVTIFGQSSGGTSVFALMTSPKAKGLFHKAWMLSSSVVLNKPLIEARKQNHFFLDRVNCTSLTCLQNLDAEEVIEALYHGPEWDILQDSVDFPTAGVFEPSLGVIDGVIFDVPPFEAWDKKLTDHFSDVPFVVGTTAQEVDFDPAPGVEIKQWDEAALVQYMSPRLATFNLTFTNISNLYKFKKDDDPEFFFTTVTSDVRVNCGNNVLAGKAASALSSPVYRYVITSFPSHEAHPLNFQFPAKYAFHGWDLYAFLDTYSSIMKDTRSSDQLFAALIQATMLEFVRRGEPAANSWRPYPGSVALLGSQLKVNSTDYNKPQCDFWNKHDFLQYSWIN